jgi:hypothetical protein
MDLTQLSQFISTVGFPAAICVWVLYRSDKREERTQEILTEIKEVLAGIKEKVK